MKRVPDTSKTKERKMIFRRISAALPALLLMACATTQPTNELLNEAESTYETAKMSSGILNTSAREMDLAGDALKKAKSMHDSGKQKSLVDHYATVALKNAEIAQERLQLKQTNKEIDKANVKRQQMLVDARASEAETANRELANVRSEAEQARAEAEQAKAEALQMAAQMDDLKAEQSQRGIVLTLQDIVFAFNSAELEPGGERTVDRIAKYLNEYPKRKLTVEGFTDSVGSEDYNLELSKKRAESIRRALVEQGVERNRINTEGLGESYPVASNDTDAGRQQNRRVEVIVSNQNDTTVSDR